MEKGLILNILVNCSLTRLNSHWMAVVLPMRIADIFRRDVEYGSIDVVGDPLDKM